MEKDISQWTTNFKKASVKLYDGSVLNGVINIGEFKRLSDKLKRKDEHIVVLVGSQAEKSEVKTYIVNTEHVIWVETTD
jgi:Flp pilus assembly CpaE family ATPase